MHRSRTSGWECVELSGAFLKSKDSDLETSWTKTRVFPNNEGFGGGQLFICGFLVIFVCVSPMYLKGLIAHV